MIYVALLRGINVGGNNKVEMARLKLVFETLGFDSVKTFINSGNVVFGTTNKNAAQLVKRIEKAIAGEFGFAVTVLLRDLPQIEKLVQKIPKSWVNDATAKCDVLFLQHSIDSKDVLQKIPANPDIETLRYEPGAVLWYIQRTQASKSKVPKIIGTPLYKEMTIRNANSVRKIFMLMQQAQENSGS